MSTLPESLSLSNSHTWAAVGVAAAGWATWYLTSNTNAAKARRAGAVLAPGPKRTPLLGNMFNFPMRKWYENFTQWAEDYGMCRSNHRRDQPLTINGRRHHLYRPTRGSYDCFELSRRYPGTDGEKNEHTLRKASYPPRLRHVSAQFRDKVRPNAGYV